MHLEFHVEDSSGASLIKLLVPKILGEYGQPHSWRVHDYKGLGHLPRDLRSRADPSRRILLDRLPRLLKGLSSVPHVDAIVVVLDADKRDCKTFLAELKQLAGDCGAERKTMFRLAIEEIEAWYFGDRDAIVAAYPQAKRQKLDRYQQDSVCDTWETLAEAIHPGGLKAVEKRRGPNAGDLKHEWAARIGQLMVPARNCSPSFRKFHSGLLRLTSVAPA
jgi:hypothetical protein